MNMPRAALAACLAALLLAPSAASADDTLTLNDTTTPIAPGITLRKFDQLSASGWLRARVITADLSRSSLHSQMLVANGVAASAAPLSQTATQAGAVAAINGDFFNIGDTNATSGFEMLGDTLLKSSNAKGSRTTVAGVDADGLGRLATLTLTGTIRFSNVNHQVGAVNSPAPPANTIDVFTSDWGDYTRNSGSFRGATPLAEVIVTDGKVVSKSAIPGSGRLAPGTYALVARGATSVNQLNALNVGDPVDITFGVTSNIAQKLQYAIGGAAALVKGGVVQTPIHYDSPSDEVDVAGRPAVGFKDGGKTLLLVVVDGRQTDFKGLDANGMANFMKSLGADDALLFDGGGSTEMVARNLGDPFLTVQNTPSDGAERPVPNGVGLFAAKGDGTAHSLTVTPDDPRIFPGLHRTFAVKAVDDQDAPVSTATQTLHAPDDATGTLTLHSQIGGATLDTPVRVLGKLATIEVSNRKLAFPDQTPQTLTVTGRDADGFAAPLEFGDLDLSYDHAVISVSDGLKITPVGPGTTMLTIKAGDVSTTVAVSVGVVNTPVYTFAGANTRWALNGTANTGQVASDTPDGIQITYDTARNMGVTAGGDVNRQVALPGQPLRVDVRLKTNQATTLDSIVLYDAKNTSYTSYGTPPTVSTDWQTVQFIVPAGVTFPLRLNGFQLVETDVSKQRAGAFTIGEVSVDAATPVADPPADAMRPDPLVSPDGALSGAWTFATASNAAALAAAQATHPDVVLADGDPQRTFDHEGTRFIELDSSSGSLHGTQWVQMPAFQQSLADAQDDDAVRDIVVFTHRTIDDLTDRTEVALVEKLLSASHKPVVMIGTSSTQMSVERIEGVAYVGLPAQGFVRWSGDLKADVHSFARSVALNAPPMLEVGDSAIITGSVTQPDGTVVPLDYPLSVHWGVISGDASLDPVTHKLTALHPGAVTITATEGGVTAMKTILIAARQSAGGTVPATLALTLGAPASFGAFTPGVARTYTATTSANVISTAGDATLSVGDPGHLANGAFTLPQPLQVDITPATWDGPVSNGTSTLTFTQDVGAGDALRTGTYSRTLTFTLSTTTP